ncbi:MAG: hypothetical protein JST68_06870 [Bacteroidetes bacterium]|nr:hypothetical protein [Bacteroidota bacterium]
MYEKYILLDIDGVMVPATSWKPLEFDMDGFYKFNYKAQKELDRDSKWKDILRKRLININKVYLIDDYLQMKFEGNNPMIGLTQETATEAIRILDIQYPHLL